MKPSRRDAVKIARFTLEFWLTVLFGRPDRVRYMSRTGTRK